MRCAIALLALLVAALGASSARANHAGIAVTLESPPAGTVVPYYGASPWFRWQLAFANGGQRGTIWLEVSATRTFRQEALRMFDCGYTPGPCTTSFRWPDRQPYWYDLSDSCADLPPLGACRGRTAVFYWRVRFEPEGTSRKVSSPIGMIRRAGVGDARPPTATAMPGTGAYGVPDRFFYYASARSGASRAEFELFRGADVVYGARNDWDRSGIRRERYEDLILPASVHAGSYRWCLTVYDYSGNHSRSCAPYTLTG